MILWRHTLKKPSQTTTTKIEQETPQGRGSRQFTHEKTYQIAAKSKPTPQEHTFISNEAKTDLSPPGLKGKKHTPKAHLTNKLFDLWLFLLLLHCVDRRDQAKPFWLFGIKRKPTVMPDHSVLGAHVLCQPKSLETCLTVHTQNSDVLG